MVAGTGPMENAARRSVVAVRVHPVACRRRHSRAQAGGYDVSFRAGGRGPLLPAQVEGHRLAGAPGTVGAGAMRQQ